MLVAGTTMATADHGKPEAQPLIIGHRGASAYRPEHTLASYELAARMGADYIEPDLVATKDGVLVARHENEISGTTDVAAHPEFADRKKTKVIDGASITGWFTEDLTLAELKTLRAKERLPAVRQENTIYDGRFAVPTFQDVLDLRERLSRELDRDIGVYPETKHPTYFKSIGLDLTPKLVKALRGQKNVFIQSFEDGNLRQLHRDRVKFPLVQLLTATQPYDAAAVAKYADGVGPDKTRVTKAFVDEAHAKGLVVHPYTFRAENQFLPADLRSSADPNAYGNVIAEMQRYFAMGVDGLFTDNPDIGVEARR
jgi:glycerophosphoryl diester phosphodiesterase